MNTGNIGIYKNGVQFCSWFQEPVDQYIYFQKTITTPFPSPEDSPIGNIALHVQRTGEADPVLIMDDFGQKRQSRLRCNIALSPDGNTAIVPMYEMSKEYIVQANLNIGSLELLPFPSDWNDLSVEKWSPDGRWLLFGSTIDDYFWEFFQQSEPSEKAIRVIDSLSSHDWAGDSEWPVYQDGNLTLISLYRLLQVSIYAIHLTVIERGNE